MRRFLQFSFSKLGIGSPKVPNLRLVFIHHAEFEEANNREIVSEQGKIVLGKLVEKLKERDLTPDVIYSSVSRSAEQSTDIIAKNFPSDNSNLKNERCLVITDSDLGDNILSKMGRFAKIKLRVIKPSLKTVFCVSHDTTIANNVIFLAGDRGLKSYGDSHFYKSVSELKNSEAVVLSFSQYKWTDVVDDGGWLKSRPMSIEIIGP